MRALLCALAMVVVPLAAFAGTDIVATCYKDCEAQTHSNPEYKVCVARAADKADAALNQAYKVMQDKIRAAAQGDGPAGRYPSRGPQGLTEVLDQFPRRELHARGQSRLRWNGDRRQLLVMSLLSLL